MHRFVTCSRTRKRALKGISFAAVHNIQKGLIVRNLPNEIRRMSQQTATVKLKYWQDVASN